MRETKTISLPSGVSKEIYAYATAGDAKAIAAVSGDPNKATEEMVKRILVKEEDKQSVDELRLEDYLFLLGEVTKLFVIDEEKKKDLINNQPTLPQE